MCLSEELTVRAKRPILAGGFVLNNVFISRKQEFSMVLKPAAIAAALLVLLACGTCSAQEAQPITLSIAPVNATTYLGSTMNYALTIENNQGVTDGVTIIVNGIHLEWMNLESNYIELLPHSSRELYFAIYPLYETGTFAYKIAGESHVNAEVKPTVMAYITVLPEPKIENVVVDRLFVKKSGEKLVVDMGLFSRSSEPADVVLRIEDLWGGRIEYFTYSQAFTGGRNVTEIVTLPADLKAGKYKVVAEVVGTGVRAQANFYVEAVNNISQVERSVANPFASDVSITVTNNGNTDESGYDIVKKFQKGLMVSWKTPYSRCDEQEASSVCVWSVDVPAGESVTVSYRIEYWPAMLEMALIAAAIISVILLLFIKISRPTIKKSYMKVDKDRYTIFVEIKNPFFKRLTNVVLKDMVTSLATVEPTFETVKPTVRKSESRTEIMWKLSDFGAREERLIHYNITTVLHGSLKMPKATVSFMTESGRKYVIESKPLIID